MQKIKCSKRYEEKNLIIIEGKYPSSLACVPHSHPRLYPGWCSLEHSRGCCVQAHWILREEGGWEKTYDVTLKQNDPLLTEADHLFFSRAGILVQDSVGCVSPRALCSGFSTGNGFLTQAG